MTTNVEAPIICEPLVKQQDKALDELQERGLPTSDIHNPASSILCTCSLSGEAAKRIPPDQVANARRGATSVATRDFHA
jgi:hypothetical protein